MGFVNERRWGRELGAAVVISWVLGGCGMLLGLDEYGLQTCDDGMKGTGEVDVDCGGVCGKACAPGMRCGAPGDCESGVCNASGRCEAATCSDGLKNGDESDEDCGGGCGATCGPGGICEGHGDCVGGVCEGGACAPTCSDGEKSGSETDVDCGGADCGKCELGEGCGEVGDCETGVCHTGKCIEEHVWSKSFGDSANQSGTSISIDSVGDVVVVGDFAGTLNFGGAQLISQDIGTMFIAKFDAGGGHLWSKRYETSETASNARVVTGSDQSIFVACRGTGGVDLGGGPLGLAGKPGTFIAKLQPDGNHDWSIGFTASTGVVAFHDLAIDSTGSAILVGVFTTTVDFGDGSHTNADNFEDGFVLKLHPDGSLAWSRAFESNLNVPPMRVTAAGSGDVVIAGELRKSINFGGGPLTSAGSDDVFIARLSSEGNHVSSKRFGDAAAQVVRGISTDTNGNVVIAGNFMGALDFGGGPLTSKGGQELFVAKLSAAGEHTWSVRFGDVGELGVDARGTAVDASGSVLIAGQFGSTVDFGGGPLTSAGSFDAFVLKLGEDGKHLWSRRFGDQDTQFSPALAVDKTGLLALTGGFQGSINFGGGELVSSGAKDVFIAKLAYP